MAGLLQCLIQHIKGHISTVGTVTACALLVKTALVELLKWPFEMIVVFLHRVTQTFFCHELPDAAAIRVPMFYSHYKQLRTGLFVPTLTSIVAMLFGGIHCAGWNFPFPSHAELIIWRVSSLILLIVPSIGLLTTVLRAMDVTERIGTIIMKSVLLTGILIYPLARFTLFVEAFITLWHLPPGAYAVVDWTALLLHL